MTLRLVPGLPSLRSDHFTIIVDAIRDAHRDDGRITNFTVEHDHIHLMGEADGAAALTSLMKRIQIRIAKRLNRALGRRGRVFADRYHVQPLKTPRQVHHTLTYLLLNHRKHVWQRWQRELGPDWLDPYSTGPWFDGWDRLPDYFGFNAAGPNPTEPPRTWLLRAGWRRYGPIRLAAVPGRKGRRNGERVASENRAPCRTRPESSMSSRQRFS